MSSEISFIEYLGSSENGYCGYCKGNNAKKDIFGAWAHVLSVDGYQRLVDRGWRRSGCYLYKPTMEETCCPQYSIRLDVHRFELTRTQKRVLKGMKEYLKTGNKPRETGENHDRPMREDKTGTDASQTTQKKTEKKEHPSKKKDMRRARAIARWTENGWDVSEMQRKRKEKEEKRKKTLEERIEEGDERTHQLTVQLVSVNSEEFAERADESFQLFEKYQVRIHDDKKVTRSGYSRFLVKSPLSSVDPRLGSFHQRYFLDGRLVAVGVLDILPRCVSSKYFFYDPDLNFLSLGTYAALREIAFIRHLSESISSIQYYYMGYYIVNCQKMRYKGKFHPSDLLCDYTFKWVPLPKCLKMLEESNNEFIPFCPGEPKATRMNKDRARIYHNKRVHRYANLPSRIQDKISDKLSAFCDVLGPEHEDGFVLLFSDLERDNEDDEEDTE